MIQRYIKLVNGKWYDVHVEFGDDGIGRVIEVFVTDKMPEFDESQIIYSQQ